MSKPYTEISIKYNKKSYILCVIYTEMAKAIEKKIPSVTDKGRFISDLSMFFKSNILREIAIDNRGEFDIEKFFKSIKFTEMNKNF